MERYLLKFKKAMEKILGKAFSRESGTRISNLYTMPDKFFGLSQNPMKQEEWQSSSILKSTKKIDAIFFREIPSLSDTLKIKKKKYIVFKESLVDPDVPFDRGPVELISEKYYNALRKAMRIECDVIELITRSPNIYMLTIVNEKTDEKICAYFAPLVYDPAFSLYLDKLEKTGALPFKVSLVASPETVKQSTALSKKQLKNSVTRKLKKLGLKTTVMKYSYLCEPGEIETHAEFKFSNRKVDWVFWDILLDKLKNASRGFFD